MILHLKINLDSPRFFEVCDHFGALGVKVLKCQIYLKGVTYVNTEETRLSNEQEKLWNMKCLYKWKNLQGTGKCITSFGPI